MARNYNYRKTKGKKKMPSRPKAMSDAEMAWALAKKAYQGLKYIKTLVNSELYKYDTISTPNTAITGSGYNASFVDIAIGDGDNARTGNSILVKGVRLTGSFRNNTTSPVPWTRVRVMIVRDTQEVADTLYPSVSDLLENTGASICLSPLNSNTVGRFTVLYDKVFTLDTLNKPQGIVKAYCPINKHVRYNGSGNTDIQKGNIFYMIICDNTNVSYNNPVLEQIQTRTYYHDN